MNPTHAIQILKVEPQDANNLPALRRAFHAQALKWHPDKNNNSNDKHNAELVAKRFQSIHEAYQILVGEASNAMVTPNNSNNEGELCGLFGHLDDFFNSRKRTCFGGERGTDRSRRRDTASDAWKGLQTRQEEQQQQQQEKQREQNPTSPQLNQTQKEEQKHPKHDNTTHLKQNTSPSQLNQRVDVDLSQDEEEEQLMGGHTKHEYTSSPTSSPRNKRQHEHNSHTSGLHQHHLKGHHPVHKHTASPTSSPRMSSHVDLSSPASTCSNTSSTPSVHSAWHLDDKNTDPFGPAERPMDPFRSAESHTERFGAAGRLSSALGHAERLMSPFMSATVGQFGPTNKHTNPFRHADSRVHPFMPTAADQHVGPFGAAKRFAEPLRPAEGLKRYATEGKPQRQSITTTSSAMSSYCYESNGQQQSGWSCQWSSTTSTSTVTMGGGTAERPSTSPPAAVGLSRSATLRDW